jgi:hypothetical protein
MSLRRRLLLRSEGASCFYSDGDYPAEIPAILNPFCLTFDPLVYVWYHRGSLSLTGRRGDDESFIRIALINGLRMYPAG